MMSKNRLSYRSMTVAVCTALIGLTTPTCTSFATPSPTAQNLDKNTSNIKSQNKNTPARTKNPARASNSFGIHEGMKYKKARNILIQKGWKPHFQGEPPNLRDTTVRELYDLGYEEVKDCSGTGLGPCRFEFTNAAGKLLVVSTISAGNSNSERVIWRYYIEEGEQGTNNNQSYSSVPKQQELPFIGTRYFNFEGGSGTGRTITIQADGTTIVKIQGTVSTSVEYKGKFSNPIIFVEGDGLVIRGKKIYRLSTNGQIAKGCKGEETLCESDLYNPSSSRILDGFYAIGGTGQGIEVKGGRYRYYSEGGNQEWRQVSELEYVKDGVVYDGVSYWCLLREGQWGVCTANGWRR